MIKSQSETRITFDTQVKTALTVTRESYALYCWTEGLINF